MSCLFIAIQKLLYKELYHANISDLRKVLCNYMEQKQDSKLSNDSLKLWLENISLDKYNEINIKRYIEEMRKDYTWGGAPEIALVSKIFKVIIIVHYGGNKIAEFNNCDDKVYKKLYLQWTGGHYEPIKYENIK